MAMTGDDSSPARARTLPTTRMDAFSDGVFAIAITLLVLEIEVPADAEQDLLRAVAEQWPSYLAYLVSFSTIGAIWLRHTVITAHLAGANGALIRLNLLLLLVVSFLPFPTRLLAENVHAEGPERVATTIYGVNLMLASVLIGVIWRYARTERLVRPDADDPDLVARITPSLGAYVVMIVVGLFLPLLAVLGYLAIAVYIIVPFHAIRRRRPSPEA